MARAFSRPNYDVDIGGLNEYPGRSAIADAMAFVQRSRAMDEANLSRIQALAQQRAAQAAENAREAQRMQWEREQYVSQKQDADLERAMSAVQAGLSTDDALMLAPGAAKYLPVLKNWGKVVRESEKKKELERQAEAIRPMLKDIAGGPIRAEDVAQIAQLFQVDPQVVVFAHNANAAELAEKERIRLANEAGKNARSANQAAATGALSLTQREIAIDRLRRTATSEIAKWEEPLAQAEGAIQSQDAAAKTPKDMAAQRLADAQLLLGMARVLNPTGTLATFDVDITRGNIPWPFNITQTADRVLRGSGIMTPEERSFMRQTLERRLTAIRSRRANAQEYVRRGAGRIGVPVEEILPPTPEMPAAPGLPPTAKTPTAAAPTPAPGSPPTGGVVPGPNLHPASDEEQRRAYRALRASGVKRPTAQQIADMIIHLRGQTP